MTRVTAPISKLTRSLGSHPSVARPSYLSSASKAAGSLELSGDGRSSEPVDHSGRRTIAMAHRPTPAAAPSKTRTVPLMQTFAFQTSAAAAAQLDTSTIDFAVLPSSDALFAEAADDPFARLRVPLLPDNFSPDRARLEGHGPEAPDAPLAAPEIIVLAAHPENVVPAALTEIEGMGVDGVELNFAHEPEPARAPAAGMLRDLWTGLIDDVLAPTKVAF